MDNTPASPHAYLRSYAEYAATTNDRKTPRHAAAMNGQKFEDARTRRGDGWTAELSFLERLGLLVDRQWNWRENQALTGRLKAARLRGNACVEDIDYRASRGLVKASKRDPRVDAGVRVESPNMRTSLCQEASVASLRRVYTPPGISLLQPFRRD